MDKIYDLEEWVWTEKDFNKMKWHDCNLSIEIDTICMEQPKKPKNSDYIKKDLEWKWKISTQCGEIRFQSVGYEMYVRSQPLLQQSQEIGFTERGGISFYQGYYAELN